MPETALTPASVPDDQHTVTLVSVDEDDPAALYRHYLTQSTVQPAHVELDLEDAILSAGYNGEVGPPYAQPEAVWHRRSLRWSIPVLTAAEANRLLRELLPLAQRILDDSTIEFNGDNMAGTLGPAAQAAEDELNDLIADFVGGEVEETDETWFDNGEIFVGLKLGDFAAPILTADTTDDQLTEIEEGLRQLVPVETPGGHVVLHGVHEWLTELREELRIADRDALSRTIAEIEETVERLTAKRDAHIVRQVGWGDGHREVAKRAGLTHPTVARIVKDAQEVTS